MLSFFNSLIYICQKSKKSTCIIYYKIGFELLIDICQRELKSKDDEINNISKFQKEQKKNENEEKNEQSIVSELYSNKDEKNKNSENSIEIKPLEDNKNDEEKFELDKIINILILLFSNKD